MSKNFINKVKMFVKKHPILCGIGASALAGTVCYIIGSKKGYSSGKSFAYSELQNVFDNGYRETILCDQLDNSRFAMDSLAEHKLFEGAALMNLKPGESALVWRRPTESGPDLYINTYLADVEETFGEWFDGCLEDYKKTHKEA